MLSLPALRSELLKIVSLRLPWRLLIVQLIIGALACLGGTSLARLNTQPEGSLLLGRATLGWYVALAVACLAAATCTALSASAEFRYATLAPTLLATPVRDRMLTAKFLVAAGVGAVFGASAAIVGALCLLVFAGPGFFPSFQLVTVALAGVVAAACWAVIGTGLGLALRSPVIALLVLLAWCPLGELLVATAIGAAGIDSFGALLPCFATLGTIAAGTIQHAGPMPGWPAAPLLLLAWTAAAAGAGWFTARERDLLPA